MAYESLIQTCIFGSIIDLNIHNLVCLSILNEHEQNLKAQSISQIQKGGQIYMDQNLAFYVGFTS